MTNPAYKIAISEGSRTQIVYLYTQSGYWTVPLDWNNLNNKIEAIGGGGGGSSNALGGGGGGGGAYTAISNVTLTPGVTYSIAIGSGGAAGSPSGSAGTSTTFNSTTLIAAGGAGGLVAPGTASGGLASACTPSTSGVAQSGGSGGAGAGNASYPQSSMGGGGGGAAGPGYAGKSGGAGNLSIAAGGGGGAGGTSSTVGLTGSSVNGIRSGGSGGVGPAAVGSGNGSITSGEIGAYGGGGGGGGFGNIAIYYSTGTGGYTPSSSGVGGDGGNTTVTVLGITITGSGGKGSALSTTSNTVGGAGSTTIVGSIYSTNGGYGSATGGGWYSGGGGGAIGGGNGSPHSGTAGGAGGQSVDFNGLQNAVTSLGYTWNGVGIGGTSGAGGDAAGFGCGGGGGYGSSGGAGHYGGKGLWGGGGGGYGGNWSSGFPASTASGGNGIVILQYVTNTGVTSNIALTGTTTYYVPNNTASFKIWAIGAGGGSGVGVSSNFGSPGGGAGGIAYMSVTGGYNGGSGGGGGNGTVSSNGWVTNLLQYAGPGGGGGGAAPAGNVTTLTGSSGTAGSGGYYGGGGGGGITGSSGAPGLLAISYVPTGYSNVSDVDDLLVLRSNFVPGNMYAWGFNSNGQLGNGTTTAVSSPIHIGSATDWKETSLYPAGYTSAAISTSGNLYVWGSNGSGLLGLGDTTDRSVPTQLGPLTTWKQISFGGANSAVAIKSDGSMWGWGSFSNYQLGNGLASGNASSPVQVGKSLYNWKQVATGNQFGLAIANDGTLWAWGLNSSGQLGQPDLTFPARSTPVQVGTLTSWKYVAVSSSVYGGSSYGITADGSLWAWGYNSQGQLGLGDTVNRSVPAQIGTGVWRSVAAGLDHVVAVNASGKLFTWGNNDKGQLGQNTAGTASCASSPVQVGLLSDWKTAIAGSYSSGGIKSNNTFWTWGANASGQLGQGNINGYSSPTQVGSLTTWKSAGIGQYHALATIYSF